MASFKYNPYIITLSSDPGAVSVSDVRPGDSIRLEDGLTYVVDSIEFQEYEDSGETAILFIFAPTPLGTPQRCIPTHAHVTR